MKRWSWQRTRVLLLAVLLGLGMSRSLVQGGVMAAEMAIAADDSHHGPSGCNGCGRGDHNDMNAGTCLAACGPAAQGVMPGKLLALPPASRTDFQIARQHLSGQLHTPDHGPPKILILG
jgi:hypothetical protein